MGTFSKWLNNIRVSAPLIFSRKNLTEIFWRRLDSVLFPVLLFLSGAVYYLSQLVSAPANSWLVNVSAGIFSSMFIIFGIDALHRSRIEKRKRRGHDLARKDLQRLANMCVSYFLFPLNILSQGTDHLAIDTGPNWSAATNRLALNKALQGNFAGQISHITQPEFRNLMTDLILLGNEIRDDITFYGELMPPEVLGELLYVRQAYNDASTKFAMFGSTLFAGGDQSRIHTILGDAVLNYTAKVDDFTKELGNWNI